MAWPIAASSASPAGWPRESLKRLERVEIQHQRRERLVRRRSRRASSLELALERAVVAQPGQRVLLGAEPDRAVGLGVLQGDRGLAGEQLGQLELVLAEVRLGVAHPADVERARSPRRSTRSGTTIIDSGSNGVPGTWTERGSRWASFDEHGLAMVDDPAGDAGPERALVGEDEVGEAVAGDDRAAHRPDPVARGRS